LRIKFNLDITDFTRFLMLIHGGYGVGKTHLLGDMLLTEREQGDVRYVNLSGEDGYLSIRNLGLGDCAETVETLDDLKQLIGDYKKAKLAAVALDGGKWLGKLVIKGVCGDRLPKIGRDSDDWTRIHNEFETIVATVRHVAPVVVLASSSDKSVDQVSGETVLSPDLPGRQAAGIGSQVDFAFQMQARPSGPNQVRRWLNTAPSVNTVTRVRLPRPLPHEIVIPDGRGGWKKVKEAIENALKPVEAK
jgi:hypothetical protein